jgi:hypothetical protein
MGAEHRKLGASGEADLVGHGVSYCATCDAAFFRDRQVVVIGGGDSTMEEAAFLARFAATVTVIHRRNEFRASRIMLERVRSLPGVRFHTPYAVEDFLAHDGRLAAVRLRHTPTNDTHDLEADGAFIAIGHQPQSALVAGSVGLDDAGYVRVQARSTRTKRPGVFGAGDLIDPHYRRAITAAGSGCQAALDAEHYLRDTTPVYRLDNRRGSAIPTSPGPRVRAIARLSSGSTRLPVPTRTAWLLRFAGDGVVVSVAHRLWSQTFAQRSATERARQRMGTIRRADYQRRRWPLTAQPTDGLLPWS